MRPLVPFYLDLFDAGETRLPQLLGVELREHVVLVGGELVVALDLVREALPFGVVVEGLAVVVLVLLEVLAVLLEDEGHDDRDADRLDWLGDQDRGQKGDNQRGHPFGHLFIAELETCLRNCEGNLFEFILFILS